MIPMGERDDKKLQESKTRLNKENTTSKEKPNSRPFVSNIIGTSSRIQEIIKLIEKVSDSPLNVLITGESGTGKELAARTIHTNSSRFDKPFVAINCAALPESLFESELFGIEKGVATGVERRAGKIEMASGGTLFLDEIGDMSLSAQAKLLRVLQERKLERIGGRSTIEVDVRVIAATNKDLKSEIKKGNFREDLYFRLNAVHINMPPLREIKEDVPLLAQHFLSSFVNELGRDSMHLSPEAMDCLVKYDWPGNVRELENEIKRAAILVDSDVIEESDLSDNVRCIEGMLERAPAEESTRFLRGTVEEIEIRKIKEALEKCGGNKQRASEILGISRQGLINKMKRYGLSSEAKPEIGRSTGSVQECQNCGKENPPNKEFCSECGHKLGESVKPTKAPKSEEPQGYPLLSAGQSQFLYSSRGEPQQGYFVPSAGKSYSLRFFVKGKPGLAIAISVLLIAIILVGGWFVIHRTTLFNAEPHRLGLLYVRSQGEYAGMAQLIEEQINRDFSTMPGIEWIAREGMLDLFSKAGVKNLRAIEELEINACEAARQGGLDYSLVGRLKSLGENRWRLDSEIICTTTRSVVETFSTEGTSVQNIVSDLRIQVQEWIKEKL